jgi:hypothetical protein
MTHITLLKGGKNDKIYTNMHTKKRTTKSAVIEPNYESPQWIYDTLMEEIEPDLMSANIKYHQAR